MKMISCSQCGDIFDVNSEVCENCGSNIVKAEHHVLKLVLYVLPVLVILIGLSLIFN